MKRTIFKMSKILCSLVMMLALMAGFTNAQVFAAANGIYIATASPHYKHPVTGNIEDSGGENSAVLGQSMTESALYKQALVEVDASGNTYVTIRLQLMDNIQDPQFQTASGSGSFRAVSATLMQEDYSNNTSDFRMQVPDENAIIRCNMFVTAMGREVIFYITVSGLTNGSGDFVTSIPAPVQQNESQGQSAGNGQSSSSQTNDQNSQAGVQDNGQGTSGNVNSQSAQTSTQTNEQNTEINSQNAQTNGQTTDQTISLSAEGFHADGTQAVTTTSVSPSATEVQTEVSKQAVDSKEEETSAKKKTTGLQEFDADGNKVKEETDSNADNKDGSSVIGWVIGIVVVAAAVAGGAFWYFRIYKKKQGGE